VLTVRQALPKALLAAAGFASLVALLVVPGPPALAVPTSDDVIFQSSDLKIYRAMSRSGAPIVVLTNLDDAGNRFLPSGGPCESTAAADRSPAGPTAETPEGEVSRPGHEDRASSAPSAPPSGSVKVVLNPGEGENPADERTVDVRSDGSGGTTVIININPPASPEKEAVIVPAPLVYPVVALGGLPGPYRYPSHLPFLGYGLDVSSPSWFGGLGLNAGNGFGLKTGAPCERGFDCMFGPPMTQP
jgi:hypothetical protein